MTTDTAFRVFECLDCGRTVDDVGVAYRCPDCDGLLGASYDESAFPDRATVAARDAAGPRRYAEFLPFSADATVSLDEGNTPAVDCPSLADDLGVATALIKDEGRNPTGAAADRGLSLAVTAAVQRDATDVALPTTGNGGQSAAAYAGRAGIDSHSFVPTRCPFVNKAMVNVHGGDMNVVEGRYADALAAYEDAVADGEEWAPVGPASPYRREGAKTVYFELVEALRWEAPDAVVVPVGHGNVIAGLAAAIDDLDAAGIVADSPRLYAVQPEGCPPVYDSWAEQGQLDSVETPDTIVGPLEIGDPAAGDLAVDAVDRTDGRAVVVDDDAILEAGADAASETGVEVGATGGVAVAGARALADDGHLNADDTVALLNPVAGSKEADLLRSYLMSQGM
ncbi:pyridoxal-phosphate dependent enzyme [Halobacteria archaeon HArc-gm2]|nr:pyridoxal-phosphate dependent enzyme [Halobacteria archaeon HArc-gm2]